MIFHKRGRKPFIHTIQPAYIGKIGKKLVGDYYCLFLFKIYTIGSKMKTIRNKL